MKVSFLYPFLKLVIRLFLFFIGTTTLFANTKQFINLSKKNGLMQDHVLCVAEDSKGFVWLGTYGGLDRFDGYTFRHFIYIDDDSTTISHSTVYTVLESSNRQQLYVGTEKGISIIDLQTLKVHRVASVFSSYAVRTIVEYKDVLYIGTYGHGIFTLDLKTGLSKPFERLPKEFNYVNTIFIESNGQLWVGLESHGIYTLSLNDFTHQHLLPTETINKIIPSEDKIIVGTWNTGFYLLDKKSGIVLHQLTILNGLPDNTIRDICDYSKDYWVAGTKKGLVFIQKDKLSCDVFEHNDLDARSLADNYIWSLSKDRNQSLLVGTFGKGLSIYNPQMNKFEVMTPSKKGGPSSQQSRLLGKDSQQRVWVSTVKGSIEVYQSSASTLFHLKIKDDFSGYNFNTFYEDKDHYIWLASDKGLFRFTPSLDKKVFFPDSLFAVGNGFQVYDMVQDGAGNLWIGGWQRGLIMVPEEVFDHPELATKKIKIVKKEDNKVLQSNTIWCLSYDPISKSIWVGGEDRIYQAYSTEDIRLVSELQLKCMDMIVRHDTLFLAMAEGNVIQYHFSTKKIIDVSLRENNRAFSVYGLVDNGNSIFVGSEHGVFQLFKKDNTYIKYDYYDGMPDESVISHTAMIIHHGYIYATTADYIVRLPINTTQSKNDYKSSFYITDIDLLGQPIQIDKDDIDPNGVHHLSLHYNENVFSFRVSPINPLVPDKVLYEVMLEGFDTRWYLHGARNQTLSYTNLNPGKYRLLVKAHNSSDEPVVLMMIVVSPPWWNTWWFKVGVLLFAVLIVYLIIYWRTRAIQKRNQLLKDQIEERTRELQDSNHQLVEQVVEINDKNKTIMQQQTELLENKYHLEKYNQQLENWNSFQTKLIGVVSHDIRGPLQRFAALLKVVDDSSAAFVVEKMKESAEGLNVLATDLLTWVSTLSSQDDNVYESVSFETSWNKVLQECNDLVKEKQIKFNIKRPDIEPSVRFVIPLIQASWRNIVANAIRYSEVNSVIEIEWGILKGESIGIRVTDYGKGFDADEVNSVISGRGLQGAKSASLKEGAGLGLSICYDMLSRLGGKIEAASLPGSGATFFIWLPLNASVNTSEEEQQISEVKIVEAVSTFNQELLKDKTILLVEDDDAVRWALIQYLTEYVNVYELRSGKEALVWLETNVPDMAVLDINLDEVSGIDLCKKIKSHANTSHIPCMLVSGNPSPDIRKDAIASGADVFLAKPVLGEEILLHLSSYFENQEKKRKHFFLDQLPVESLTDNPINKAFLEKVIQVIESNLSSTELSVDFIAKSIGLSKSTLYRTLKSLTGLSANNFIRNIRMRKSLALLKEGKMNISEIATETGFNSPSYFTSSFKKHFGFNPTELKNK